MSTITTILTSEAGLNIIAGAVAAIWAALKASQWYQSKRNAVLKQAETIVETAVREGYLEVREMKAASPDGKLTTEQIKAIQNKVTQRAKDMGEAAAIDLATAYAPTILQKAPGMAFDIIRTQVIRIADKVSGKVPSLPADISNQLP